MMNCLRFAVFPCDFENQQLLICKVPRVKCVIFNRVTESTVKGFHRERVSSDATEKQRRATDSGHFAPRRVKAVNCSRGFETYVSLHSKNDSERILV